MKKIFSFLFVALFSVSLWADGTTTLYLKAGSVDYTTDNFVVAIWAWKTGEQGAWYTFQPADKVGVSYVELPTDRNNGIIKRWPNGTTPSWDTEATNSTGDIAFPATYPATTDMIELNDWSGATSGTWSKYTAPDPVTLYFVNKDNWTGLKAHVWTAANDHAYKAWDSDDALTATGETVDGKAVYSYTFPSSYDRIIFRGTDVQTANLEWDDDTPYFYPTAQSDNKYYSAWYATKDAIEDALAKFFISGTEALVGEGKEWNPKAVRVMDESHTFVGLAAGTEYKLKVSVNGTWDAGQAKGFSDITSRNKGLYVDESNNICFKMKEAGNVVVTYTNSVFTVEGNLAAPTVYLKRSNNSWANEAMTPSLDGTTASITLSDQDFGVDSFKIMINDVWLSKNGTGDDFYRFHRTWTEDTGFRGGSKNIVLEKDRPGNYTITWTYATDGLAITFPDALAAGFYLVGSAIGWEVGPLTASEKFADVDGEPGKYQLTKSIAAGDKLKVVKVVNGAINTWYPDGEGNEYTVDAKHAGSKTIYFKPEGDGTWSAFGGYMWIDENTAPTSIDNTEVGEKVVKHIENGQLVIIKNGVKYNALGAEVK